MAKDKQTNVSTPGASTLPREETRKTTVPPVVTPKPAARVDRRDDVTQASALPFGRRNYTLMLIGIGIILAGFFIMSLDKEEFGFGFLGLTLGPLMVMGGFIVEFFAILNRPQNG